MQEAEEYIDKSKWLPPEMPVVTACRAVHGDVVCLPGKNGGAEYRSMQDPLAFYLHRGSITEDQHDSGQKLHQLWYHGSFNSRYRVMRYSFVTSATDAEAAKLIVPEYHRAMEAIRGDRERRVAYAVCCMGVAAGGLKKFSDPRTGPQLSEIKEAISKDFGHLCQRSVEARGMSDLRSALDDLTKHFRPPRKRNG